MFPEAHHPPSLRYGATSPSPLLAWRGEGERWRRIRGSGAQCANGSGNSHPVPLLQRGGKIEPVGRSSCCGQECPRSGSGAHCASSIGEIIPRRLARVLDGRDMKKAGSFCQSDAAESCTLRSAVSRIDNPRALGETERIVHDCALPTASRRNSRLPVCATLISDTNGVSAALLVCDK
jgi:hypothetical protein